MSRHRAADDAVCREDDAKLDREERGGGCEGEGEDDLLRPRENVRGRESLPQRADSFMERRTPRPSAVFLEGINIEDLFKDDDDGMIDDEHDGNGPVHPAAAGSDNNSALGRLTSDERRALRSLDDNGDFLDIVSVMLMNSMSETVQNEGLHALSLVHNPDIAVLEECAGGCGFEVIVSAMGKCSKVRLFRFLCLSWGDFA